MVNVEAKLDEIAQFLADEERTTFTFAEAAEWCSEYKIGNQERPSLVIQGLTARGFTKVERNPPKRFRTLSSNPHDRWQASPTHGGGGGTSIVGIAGHAG